MRRQDFSYELPKNLVAAQPPAQRGDSRLLVLEGASGSMEDKHFTDLLTLVAPGDLLVFNDTRVIPARVFGQKATGGKVEVMVERVLGEFSVLAHVRASKSPKVGLHLYLEDGTQVLVSAREQDLFKLDVLGDKSVLAVLDDIGHMPLPPYIEREDGDLDKERYQTVYGRNPGAVAAPTAGLHFNDALLQSLAARGVESAFVTLHVGAGTFQPVRADNIQDHAMHSEVMRLDTRVCEQVKATKARGGRVIAVGTTSVRCLETAALQGQIAPYQGETNIFIYPSFRYQVVDALITNFHLPESTLLMLVCAFAGFENTLSAYHHAVKQEYRFFSYGDAMFVTHNPNAHLKRTPSPDC